jgi:pimeloyl-ACP methyl ester carboxylesterase
MMNPTILLHGALGGKSQLANIKLILEQQGRTVYTLNFSGHNGEAYSPHGFGIDVFSDDVLLFLNEREIDRADFFGYSMGGYVALWFASKYPSRSGEIVTLGTKFDWSVESAERETKKLDPEKISQKVPAFARILENRHKPHDWKDLVRKTSEMMIELGQHPLLTEEILKSIENPVLICLGDKDDMADRSYSERVASLIPHGKFKLLNNTEHAIEGVSYVPFLEA